MSVPECEISLVKRQEQIIVHTGTSHIEVRDIYLMDEKRKIRDLPYEENSIVYKPAHRLRELHSSNCQRFSHHRSHERQHRFDMHKE